MVSKKEKMVAAGIVGAGVITIAAYALIRQAQGAPIGGLKTLNVSIPMTGSNLHATVYLNDKIIFDKNIHKPCAACADTPYSVIPTVDSENFNLKAFIYMDDGTGRGSWLGGNYSYSNGKYFSIQGKIYGVQPSEIMQSKDPIPPPEMYPVKL